MTIFFQRHLLPAVFSEWKPENMEFFFNSTDGVLNIDAEPYLDSQTVYVESELKNVPQLHCEFSGFDGFSNHLLPPYTT